MNLAILGGVPVRREPFQSWPQYSDEEEKALLDALHSRAWGGYGKWVQRFEEDFTALHRMQYGISCANGTVALEVAMRAIGIECSDEVVVTAFTFIASASAILMAHGVPIFADIDPHTMNISPDSLESVITPRTKAVVVVHFGGHPADMDAIVKIANRHKISIIEDCSHAHGASWHGKPVGGFGAVGTFSFQAFKLATAGEGGIIVTNDKALSDASWSYCNQGRIRGGQWYEHCSLGTNYRLTAFQGAMLYTQLQKLKAQTELRTKNASYLRQRLKAIEGLSTEEPSPFAENHPQYLMTLRFNPAAFNGISREAFLEAIKAEGVPMREVYPYPLYRNPMFQQEAMAKYSCRGWKALPDYSKLHLEEVERICKEGLWLEHELFLGKEKDMDDIVDAVVKVQQNSKFLVARS